MFKLGLLLILKPALNSAEVPPSSHWGAMSDWERGQPDLRWKVPTRSEHQIERPTAMPLATHTQRLHPVRRSSAVPSHPLTQCSNRSRNLKGRRELKVRHGGEWRLDVVVEDKRSDTATDRM
ncbi:hypothetical protein C8R43DRAFT_1018096 [Mycena crocata]|nr:hypothetical protein C8R43DRAFT_1018096 [Mycena crocata]